MIFYFTGTGNSKWIAESLAKATNDEAVNLAKIDDVTGILKENTKVVGFVFPIYAFMVPKPVRNFIKQLSIPNKAFVYAIGNCASNCGAAMKLLKKILPYNSAYSVIMPNNYILGMGVDSTQTATEKISAAKKKLSVIAKEIIDRKDVFNVENTNVVASLLSPIGEFFLERIYDGEKNFRVTERCFGCGLCEEICPQGVIEIVKGKPVWKGKCVLCLGCINRCPVVAIEYGYKTIGKERYYFGKKE